VSDDDKFRIWVETHQPEIKTHEGQHLAISLSRGILAASADGDEFAAQLDALSEQVLDDMFIAHTSLLLEGGGILGGGYPAAAAAPEDEGTQK
jgi:hypothetical protein